MNDEKLTEDLLKNVGRCPKCGSKYVSASDYDGEGLWLTCRVECEKCGANWTEHYKLSAASDFEE